jgi:hypothetical protein
MLICNLFKRLACGVCGQSSALYDESLGRTDGFVGITAAGVASKRRTAVRRCRARQVLRVAGPVHKRVSGNGISATPPLIRQIMWPPATHYRLTVRLSARFERFYARRVAGSLFSSSLAASNLAFYVISPNRPQLVETERRTASVTGLWWRFRLPLPSAPWTDGSHRLAMGSRSPNRFRP